MLSFSQNSLGSTNSSAPAGYEPSIYIDASLIEALRNEGYRLEATSLTAEYALSNFQKINKQLLGDRGLNGLMDTTGNVYFVDERKIVYILSRSAVNPVSGLPNNIPQSTPSLGGPLMYTPPVEPVDPLPRGIPPTVSIPLPPAPPGGIIGSGKIYCGFNIDDIVTNQQEVITRALWTNNDGNLLTFYTSSTQTSDQKRYYYDIYNSSSAADCKSQIQFAVAYGHKLGSGSADEGGQIEDTPSRAIYGQYRLLCLSPGKEYFTIGGTTTEHIYVINVARARMREYLDEGNIELCLAHLSGSEFVAGGGLASAHTGSNVKLSGNGKVLRLIDDSSINSATIENGGEVYQIISGSIEDGAYNSSSPHIYGLLFRRQGIIVLDANKLDQSGSFATVTAREINGDNSYKLFTSISGAAKYTDGSGDYLGFQARSAEKVKSMHFFCRVKNAEYNFSNNPSFITGSEGDLYHPSFINDPRTYITSVGLYNPRKELVGVGKISKTIQKSFFKEVLLKVKLEF